MYMKTTINHYKPILNHYINQQVMPLYNNH